MLDQKQCDKNTKPAMHNVAGFVILIPKERQHLSEKANKKRYKTNFTYF